MSLRFPCSFCGALIRAPERSAGKTGRCPKCRHVVEIALPPDEPKQEEQEEPDNAVPEAVIPGKVGADFAIAFDDEGPTFTRLKHRPKSRSRIPWIAVLGGTAALAAIAGLMIIGRFALASRLPNSPDARSDSPPATQVVPAPLAQSVRSTLSATKAVALQTSGSAPEKGNGKGAAENNVEAAVYTTGSEFSPGRPHTVIEFHFRDTSLDHAEELVAAGELEQARHIAEGILDQHPGHRQALWLLARIAHARGRQSAAKGRKLEAAPFFIQCADYMRSLSAEQTRLEENQTQFYALALFDEAWACALSGNVEQALASLEGAFQFGFNDIERLDSEEELRPLRGLPAFQRLAESHRQLIHSQLQKELAREFAEFKPFPFSFSLEDTEGSPISISRYKGKLLVVDIWGTWCPYCRNEIPHFIRLQRDYQARGLEVVGIACGEEGSPAEIRTNLKAFADANAVNYRFLVDDLSTPKKVPGFKGYPTTLLIDGAGQVRLVLFGYHPYIKIRAIVTQLLDETKSGS